MTGSATPDEPDSARPAEAAEADRLRAAVLACPGVAGLSGGLLGEVVSYLPGRRVVGVRTGVDSVEVHVVAEYGPPLTELADTIGARLADLLHGRPLTVVVDDILLPGEQLDEPDTNADANADTASR